MKSEYTPEEKSGESKLGYLIALIPMGVFMIIGSNAWFEEGYSGWIALLLLIGFVYMLFCCLRIIAIDLETVIKKAIVGAWTL